MKNLFLLLASFSLTLAAAAQTPTPPPTTLPDLPVKEGQLYYEGVVDVPATAKQANLYRSSRSWFSGTYLGPKELELDDEAQGKLVGEGNCSYSFLTGLANSHVFMHFTLALEVKSGKCSYRLYNFEGSNTSSMKSGTTTRVRMIDYNQCYAAYKTDKRARTAYNLSVLQGLNTQVQLLIVALQKTLLTSP